MTSRRTASKSMRSRPRSWLEHRRWRLLSRKPSIRGDDPLHPADAPAVVAKESTPRHEFELLRIMSRR
jgi:hypothetical protein